MTRLMDHVTGVLGMLMLIGVHEPLWIKLWALGLVALSLINLKLGGSNGDT